jgi:cell division protein FtsI/penicillin-binding protein 2
VALRSNSLYVRLLSGGIAASLAIQVAVIVGGNLALFPLTGVTLPFVSYGGSSLLAWMVSAALLIRLSSDAEHAQPQTAGAAAPDLPVQRNAARLLAGLMGVLALATASLMLLRAQALVARTDNPRRVEDEQAIARGPIFARDGTPLALSAPVDEINGRAMYSRTYPLPAAVGAVGYYSQRYGAGGIEAFADRSLRGANSFGDALLHRRQIGAPLTLTLDVPYQTALSNALAGEKGAAIVLDWRTGEVLALSSTPDFDANYLDRDWDSLRANQNAPLVNRVTQGLYQPGALLAWLYDSPSVSFTWDAGDRFALSRSVAFELSNEAVPYPASGTFSETIGQGALRVTPLRIAASAAGIARGQTVTPTLILPAARAGSAMPEAAQRTGVFETVAQIGSNQSVAWHVRITEKHVVVIAIEQRETTLERLRRIASRVP